MAVDEWSPHPCLNLRYFLTLLGYEQSCLELFDPLVTHYASSSSDILWLTHYAWTLLNLLGLKHNFLQLLLQDFPFIQNACLLTMISAWHTCSQWLQLYSIFNNEICHWFFLFIYLFILISWRLITLQYCSGSCHTLTWISYGFTCVPHPKPPSPLPLHPIPLGLPSAPGLSTCLMHPAWAGDLFHPR